MLQLRFRGCSVVSALYGAVLINVVLLDVGPLPSGTAPTYTTFHRFPWIVVGEDSGVFLLGRNADEILLLGCCFVAQSKYWSLDALSAV